MLTTFCHHNQAKMETSEALSALHQHELPEPSMVVVRRYTNTPYIPQGTSCFLYLDVSTLSGGASSAQFPLDWQCLCRLLPFSETDVILPHEEGVMGLKVFPHSPEVLWQSSEEECHPTDLVSLLIPSSASLPIKKRVARWRKIQAFIQPSRDYKISITPGFSWNANWVKRHRS